MNDSNMIVVTRADGVEVIHYYATESDARFQFSEWRGQGVDCKLVLPTPTEVYLQWTTDVVEHYRTTVNVVDLPESVQAALAAGASIIDIDRNVGLEYIDALVDLWGFICDHEEGPFNEEVTARELDYERVGKGADQ